MVPDRPDESASPGAGEAAGDDGRVSGGPDADEAVEARLDDALERVAHGATVSVPSILVQRGLAVAFTATLTNGFAAGPYGVFAVARRLQRLLQHLALGFRSGLSRFLPNADTPAERDAIVAVAGALLLGSSVAFGAALYLGAPLVSRVADQRPPFTTLLRTFALGLPATVWLFTATEVLRGLEEIGPLNLTLRIGFPIAQLGAGVAGVVFFDDLLAVAVGVVVAAALVALVATGWLVRERDLRPVARARRAAGAGAGADAVSGAEPVNLRAVARRYLRYTGPLFVGGVATAVQRLGFYPLIAVYLTDVAGGVFAVGMVVGLLVRLPLMGINQLVPPVAAALHDNGHREALARLYHVTSRLVLVGVTAVAVPVVVYREAVMALFGPTFVDYAALLSGFVLAQYAACAAGSVGFLLVMTDNQRAYLLVNVVVTTVLVLTAVPLTLRYGLPGLVVGYVLMLTLNNGLEVVVLYYLEGLQPFTRRHARPLAAAVPLAGIALLVRAGLSGPVVPLAGTLLGLGAYALVLHRLGFTPAERRLAGTLAARYRAALPER